MSRKQYSKIEDWKTEVESSSHIRVNETVRYKSDRRIVLAFIESKTNPDLNIFIGAYSLEDVRDSWFKTNCGWLYP